MGTYVFSGGDGTYGFSMLDWSAGDIVALVSSVLSSSHSSTQVTYSASGEVLQARGSLGGYNEFGDPTSGTVTSFTYTTPRFGASPMSIAGSNFSLSVPTLFGWVFSGNALALHHFLFDGADTMTGSIGPDILEGYGGGDTINGGGGADILFGENFPGDDALTSAPGNDTLNGGEGDDLLAGGLGNDTLSGGAGQDTAVYLDASSGVSVSLASVGQQNTGAAGLDTLSGIENIVGSLFNDTLTGDAGANLITGSDGNDAMDGGAGVDTVSYADALSGVTVHLTLAGEQDTGGGGLDTLLNFENIIGSDFNDIMGGTAGDNSFDGGLGEDTVSYAAAAAGVSVSLAISSQQNTLGAGLDTLASIENLTGGAYSDTLVGSDAANVLNGGAGVDSISGGGGFDTIIADGGGDVLDGGEDSDLLRLVTASSVSTTYQTSTLFSGLEITFADGTIVRNFEQFDLTAGAGDDVLVVDSAFSIGLAFNGGGGTDRLVMDVSGGAGAVTMGDANVISVAGASFTANVEQYWITGGAAADDLNGGVSGDQFIGNAGHDFLTGNAGADILNGGDGDDFLFSGPEAETTYGGYYVVYPPLLDTGAERDVLVGGAGDDHLFAGYGDSIDGGSNDVIGDVLFISFLGSDQGVIADFRQSTLIIGGGTITGIETVEWIEGSDFADTIILNGTSPYSRMPDIYGMGGDDTLVADYYTSDMYGGAGNDIVDGRRSGYLDTVDGGDGDDTLYADPSGFRTAYGGAGNDTIYVSGEVHGGDGDDLIVLSFTHYLGYIYGDAGDDEIRADGFGRIIAGGTGNDLFVSGSGNDTFDGGEGRDIASFDVASDGATWSRNASGVITVTSVDGVDMVTNTEVLRFTDRDVLIDRPARSFSGNATSDILFRRSDGIMASWEVTGTSINAASFLPTAGAGWTPLGTGDFSGDGRDDVLWQRSDGLVYTWHMNGGAVASANAITGIGAEWNFLGVGDFNGDLKDDIAWRRNDGIVVIWQMNGAAIASANAVTGLPEAWQIAGFGDFNSDGRDDFLWRNSSTGQTVIWHMNGASIASTGPTSEQATLDWSIVGVGDTNGDGRDDIILQRASDGMISVWAMDGTNVLSATDVAAASPADWTVCGVGDYDGDGRDDILWQNDNGLVYVWLMNGAAIQSTGALSGIGPEWGII